MKIRYLYYIVLGWALSLPACNSPQSRVLVRDLQAFEQAVRQARPGDQIVLANGVWKDAELVLKGEGEPDKPIRLLAEEKGKVLLEGQSNLRLGGKYLEVEGLVFRNGYTPTGEVIAFKVNDDTLCYNCRVTECVIDDYNPPERFDSNYWVALYGQHNRFDHNYLVGKRNQGVTLAVRLKSEDSRENKHRIDHNHFGYRPTLGSNGGESLRIGTSHYSLSNSNTLVEDNYFEWCSGELEIISNKSCGNTFRNNTFFECQGTLTMRHGNETLVENNYFFGNGKPNTGGIRIINENQTVRRNYLQGLTGYRFRGALVVMNGVPNSPLNRYFQVKNALAANNLLIDCDHIQLCAGSDEERSAVPVNSAIVSNIFYHHHKKNIFTVYDDVSGIEFRDNLLGPDMDFPVYKGQVLKQGFERKAIEFESKDGVLTAPAYPDIGPDQRIERPGGHNTGVSWYPKRDYRIHFNTGKVIAVPAKENALYEAVRQSAPGDILELSEAATYSHTKSIDLVHPLTIRAAAGLAGKPLLTFERSSLFNIENGGSLRLEGLSISGKSSDDKPGNAVIRTSRYAMIDNYQLTVADCEVRDLDVNHSFEFIKIFKHTFADSISLINCHFENITGNVLAADKETDDLGIYNVENVVVDGCTFKDIGGLALGLYRGGTDESTFGPIVQLSRTTFENVGQNRRNKYAAAVLLHGVQLARLEELQFINSKKLKLHLIVGEPVIELSSIHFEASEGIESNDDAWVGNQITYHQNQNKQ